MLKVPSNLTAPVANQKDHSFSHHGDTVSDPYFWLKDPGYPEVTDEEVLSYLREENAYFDAVTKDDTPLVDTLFEEIKGRLKEDDEGVPYQDGAFDFRWAFAKGSQYRIWYYRPRSENPHVGDDWQVLFDENQAAEGLAYFKLGSLSVSPCGGYLAISHDSNGSERFTVKVQELKSGDWLETEVAETSGELVWAADSKSFFYVKVSKEWRPYLVMRHALDGALEDAPVFEETDSSFFLHIGQTTSNAFMVIRSADHVTAEVRVLDLAPAYAEPVLMAARRTDHDYYVDHAGGQFVVRSNKNHENYGIFTASGDPSETNWVEQLTGTDTRYIHGMQAFDRFIAVEDRIDGLDQITLLASGGREQQIPMQEAVYEVGLGTNPEAGQGFVRLGFSSLLTPPTVLDVPIHADGTPGEAMVRKVQEIPSGYDRTEYRSERLMVTARDGAQVPVSIVYKSDWEKHGGAPLHLYGYGAYGLGMSPSFSAARMSLLDRGFAYAIAHIRGGDELGKGWYTAGKLNARTNTFNDFVDVARALTDQGYAARGGISISGGSAGGELMGAVVNQAPELFKGCVLHVPFVDVLNTMLDADLPLTPIEWPEWGNPIEDADAYATIKGYCPYTNIEAKEYPPMLVTGGLNDPRVTYWEPAKWTAKMRATKTDDNLLIMKINMGAGHGGKSGRFERYREVAEEYMFLLKCFGLTN
ncbi:MAG: S9 family peptidase [Kordiimonadaceae bacterium]|nr:S9 family peptidase [Kordiimonadaceae bacterium]MBO6568841.1 S9 family peptidase [Kordiimonadaceae bacterium]MBO6965184.1 S9 family peptidase [Kordiimonadaceae bacterium]